MRHLCTFCRDPFSRENVCGAHGAIKSTGYRMHDDNYPRIDRPIDIRSAAQKAHEWKTRETSTGTRTIEYDSCVIIHYLEREAQNLARFQWNLSKEECLSDLDNINYHDWVIKQHEKIHWENLFREKSIWIYQTASISCICILIINYIIANRIISDQIFQVERGLWRSDMQCIKWVCPLAIIFRARG